MEINVGDIVKFDGYHTGEVVQVRIGDDIVGDVDVQVKTQPYGNLLWFNHNYLTVVQS